MPISHIYEEYLMNVDTYQVRVTLLFSVSNENSVAKQRINAEAAAC